jgi:hypothetical protein
MTWRANNPDECVLLAEEWNSPAPERLAKLRIGITH